MKKQRNRSGSAWRPTAKRNGLSAGGEGVLRGPFRRDDVDVVLVFIDRDLTFFSVFFLFSLSSLLCP